MAIIAMTGQQILATVLFGVFMVGLMTFFMVSIMKDRQEERARR